MTLSEALKALRNPAHQQAPPFEVMLACGFSPLHLSTFLGAHLQERLPSRKVRISTGLFGDLIGTLEGLKNTSAQAAAAVIEWRDLDRRLDYREHGEWGPAATADIVTSATMMLQRLLAALERRPLEIRITLSLPTVPYAPVFHTAGWQSSDAELTLQAAIQDFAAAAARLANTAVVNGGCLAPPADRYDLKSDLLFGFPYSIPHTDVLSSALAHLIAPPAPKKGIITDLDDTLWHGLVGEIGADNVAWDLASHHYIHGLYQHLLSTAAKRGVLVAIASKNDPAVVEQALSRPDLLISTDKIFPIEVHWGAKSASVKRILEAWNIAADSVVFIDDSPIELAEVAAVHPGIETICFPKNDYAGMYKLARRLSDLFGKEQISADDSIRLQSLRAASSFRDLPPDGASDDFLKQTGAIMTIVFEETPADARVLELVNKTNQFNLNGNRYTAGEWAALFSRPDAFVASIRYEDKFGPLGTIAVLSGASNHDTVNVDVWVMSCRAFARRIEHQCLKLLFEHFEANEVTFNFAPTPKNGPLREFLAGLCGEEPAGSLRLSRDAFDRACPQLYHQIIQTRREVNA